VDYGLGDSPIAQILTRFAAPRKLWQTMTGAAFDQGLVAAQAEDLTPPAPAVPSGQMVERCVRQLLSNCALRATEPPC
jgi:hypothetical protein